MSEGRGTGLHEESAPRIDGRPASVTVRATTTRKRDRPRADACTDARARTRDCVWGVIVVRSGFGVHSVVDGDGTVLVVDLDRPTAPLVSAVYAQVIDIRQFHQRGFEFLSELRVLGSRSLRHHRA